MKEEKDNPDDGKKKSRSLETKHNVIIKVFDIAQFIIPVITVAYFSFFIPDFLNMFPHRSPQKTTHEKLFEYLGNGLSNNQFGEHFVKTAFNHFDRKGEGVLTKYGYIETLEDFIVYLNSSIGKENSIDTVKVEEVNKLLTKARETEPFASLPSEERRLMDQVQTLLKNSAPVTDLNHTLNELKQVMLARHKEYQKIESQNAWSIPLAFAGVFFTIIFGVWSIVLSIRKKRQELQKIYFEPPFNQSKATNETAEQ